MICIHVLLMCTAVKYTSTSTCIIVILLCIVLVVSYKRPAFTSVHLQKFHALFSYSQAVRILGVTKPKIVF